MLAEWVVSDFLFTRIASTIIFSSMNNRADDLLVLNEQVLKPGFATLEKLLPEGKKFCVGDNLTWYDFFVGAIYTNVICNESVKDLEFWKQVKSELPPKVKVYFANFAEEMAEYLASRPKGCTF